MFARLITNCYASCRLDAADGGFVGIFLSDWDRNVEIAAAQARDRIDAIRNELPTDLQRIQMLKN